MVASNSAPQRGIQWTLAALQSPGPIESVTTPQSSDMDWNHHRPEHPPVLARPHCLPHSTPALEHLRQWPLTPCRICSNHTGPDIGRTWNVGTLLGSMNDE